MVEVEDAGVVTEIAKHQRGAMRGRIRRRLASHLEIEPGFLKPEDAHVTPASDGHGFEERGFGGGAGLKLGDEGVVEVLEAIHGFAFENDGLGEEAVAGGVLRRDGFAFGGDGAVGFGAVGAG